MQPRDREQWRGRQEGDSARRQDRAELTQTAPLALPSPPSRFEIMNQKKRFGILIFILESYVAVLHAVLVNVLAIVHPPSCRAV